jgi:prepilin-type N-terminal cleavage/methylation domain-containing protein
MVRNTQHKARAGFTLLEVMVSLTVGGIALSSIYAIGAASTRHFREQQRISASQTSLRAAMATLKHDFQRAGFMSTPSSEITGEVCAPPNGVQNRWLRAVNGFKKADAAKPSKLDPETLNPVKDKDGSEFFSVDEVWLTGNYTTSGEYPNITVAADGLTVTIPTAWQSFRRDFTDWSNIASSCDEIAFVAAFPPGRLVRLHAQNGTFYYGIVESSLCTTNTATVVLTEPMPSNCNMEGGWISPVNVMYYRVEDADAARDEDDVLKRTTVLRRTEVKPAQLTSPLEGTVDGKLVNLEDRSLLDYVVRFKVDFLMLETLNNTRISYVPMTELEWRDAPQRVRGAIIDLAVRTPQQEPDFTQDVPTSAFKLFKGKGAARVRRLRAELLLPNIASRNLL